MPIRLAIRTDAKTLHKLHSASVTELCDQYDTATIAAWLSGRTPEGYLNGIDSREMYVYEEQDKIHGFSHVVPGEVIALFVSPASARKGIGTALMNHAVSRARENWEGPVRLEATLNAVVFYQHLGFRKLGDRIALRNGVEIPVVEMETNEI